MTFLKKIRQQAEELFILTSVIFLVSGVIVGLANLLEILK